MVDKNDWRLTGQEKYLNDVSLRLKKYKRPREDWDHDHCSFCFTKFMEEDLPNIINEGYSTEEDYHWICKSCYVDFKDVFNWKLKDD